MNAPLRFIITLGLLSGLVAAAVDMYLPAMPALAQALGSDIGAVQQTLSMFLLGAAVSQAIFGPLADRFGRRPILLVGMTLFALSSLLCTQVVDVEQLIVLRLAQALGAAAGNVVVQALIRDLYEREEAARMMSFVMAVMTIIPLLAPAVGGYLLVWAGWQSIFWCLSLFGLLAVLLVFFSVPETLPAEKRQPLHPASLARAYWSILKHRNAMAYNLCGAFVFATMFAFITGSPFVYIEYFGVEPHYFGYLFAANIALMMCCNYFNARWIERLGSGRLLRIGIAIHVIAAGFLLLNSWTGMAGLVGVVVPCVISVGVLGLVASNSTSATLACFDSHGGKASGVLGVTRMGLGALSGAMVGVLHNGSILVMAAVMLVCAVLAWLALQGVKQPVPRA